MLPRGSSFLSPKSDLLQLIHFQYASLGRLLILRVQNKTPSLLTNTGGVKNSNFVCLQETMLSDPLENIKCVRWRDGSMAPIRHPAERAASRGRVTHWVVPWLKVLYLNAFFNPFKY